VIIGDTAYCDIDLYIYNRPLPLTQVIKCTSCMILKLLFGLCPVYKVSMLSDATTLTNNRFLFFFFYHGNQVYKRFSFYPSCLQSFFLLSDATAFDFCPWKTLRFLPLYGDPVYQVVWYWSSQFNLYPAFKVSLIRDATALVRCGNIASRSVWKHCQ
jgi:hypothetical protein